MPIAQHIIDIMKLPGLMGESEKLFLYSSILSWRPKNCLEIGAWKGSSMAIMTFALDHIGKGKVFSVDLKHQISPELNSKIAHRATLVHGNSPDAIVTAYNKAKAPFDFVFIDGDHSKALRDIEGTQPYLANPSLILFHDGQFPLVANDVQTWCDKNSGMALNHGLVDKTVCMIKNHWPHLLKDDSPKVKHCGIIAVTYRGRKMFL